MNEERGKRKEEKGCKRKGGMEKGGVALGWTNALGYSTSTLTLTST